MNAFIPVTDITEKWEVGATVAPTDFGRKAGIRSDTGVVTAVSRTHVYVRWDGREIDETCFEGELERLSSAN